MKSSEKPTAFVTLAMRADEETTEMIARFVESRGCGHIRYSIDPKILGGVIIRIGDVIYDGSVRARLEHVRRSI